MQRTELDRTCFPVGLLRFSEADTAQANHFELVVLPCASVSAKFSSIICVLAIFLQSFPMPFT